MLNTTPQPPQQTPVFNCSQCGHCCSVWQVFIDVARGDALLAEPWAQTHLKELGVSLERVGKQGYTLPLKPDLTCAFFSLGTGCLIHQRMGSDAKPIDCQRFPFAAVRLPATAEGDALTETLAYDVSAACNTIVSQHLPTHTQVQPQGLEAKASATFTHHAATLGVMGIAVPKLPLTLALWPGPVAWVIRCFGWLLKQPLTLALPTYEQRRAVLLQWLYTHAPEATPCFYGVLRHARRWMLKGLPLPSPLPKGEGVTLGLPRLGWATRCALWRELRTPLGWYQRAQWLSRGGYWDPKLLGSATVLGWGTLWKHPWPLAASQQGQPMVKLMLGYLALVLTRRVGLVYGSPWLCQWLLAIRSVRLVTFYATALSLVAEEQEVSMASMQLAIRLVERYYVAHQPRYAAQTEWDVTGLLLALRQ